MVFVKFHNMNWKKKFLMLPLNSNNLKIFQVKTILQSQFTKVQFSFLLFFNLCTVYFSKKISFLLFFIYMLCSTMFKFFSFFFCPFSIVPNLFSFCFFFFLFFFFFFFHNKLLIQCPFFFQPYIFLSLCLYLNTITIGLLPSLFNFSL